MYKSTTHDITVSVEPVYLDHESAPDKSHYVWAYHVRIENNGADTVRLRTRHWIITDSYGRTEEVHGPGVVGEQPTLKPGDHFEYTSGAPLKTPGGFMRGSYSMQAPGGEMREIEIPAFSLDLPHATHKVH